LGGKLGIWKKFNTCMGYRMNTEYMYLEEQADEDFDAILRHNEYDIYLHQECGCMRCMNCLGLSWQDFM